MSGHLPIIFAESSVRDMEDIRDYYQEQNVPEVGERLLHEIIALIEELPANPDRGRIVPEFNLQSLREMILPPFRIVYRRDQLKISIVRIWRSERLMKRP